MHGRDPVTHTLLYLGPISSMTMSQLSPLLCSDAQDSNMRLARMARRDDAFTLPS